ncbi:MAG: prephenate dehydrogenase [Myxococcota bacterium]
MTAKPVFERLVVIGLGLVGGSVALAARERGLAREVVGVDPGLESAGPIPVLPLQEAVGTADGVVVAVPVGALEGVLQDLAGVLPPEAVITDTLSVKVPVAEAVRRILPAPERCVGAHPMAGGDSSGFAHARADLFEGAPCILALEGSEPEPVVDQIDGFWQGLGALTVRTTPGQHDAIVAALSHAPHAIAFAFAQALADRDQWIGLAGQGLRDFVRIARANPGLWTEILLRNRQRVTEELARFEKNLGGIIEALARGDRDALERMLRDGQRALEKLER